MIILEQPKMTPGAISMVVEIEVLPLETPQHRYTRLRVRYLIDHGLVFEMASSIYPYDVVEPLAWLRKAVKTRRKVRTEKFGSPTSGEHLICIEQHRLSDTDFAQIQSEAGIIAFPFPFLYDMGVLVNYDLARACRYRHNSLSHWVFDLYQGIEL